MKCFCYGIILKSSRIVACPVESEETTSVQKGFTKTFAAMYPQFKFLEPRSDFRRGKESRGRAFGRTWMLPAPGLQITALPSDP